MSDRWWQAEVNGVWSLVEGPEGSEGRPQVSTPSEKVLLTAFMAPIDDFFDRLGVLAGFLSTNKRGEFDREVKHVRQLIRTLTEGNVALQVQEDPLEVEELRARCATLQQHLDRYGRDIPEANRRHNEQLGNKDRRIAELEAQLTKAGAARGERDKLSVRLSAARDMVRDLRGTVVVLTEGLAEQNKRLAKAVQRYNSTTASPTEALVEGDKQARRALEEGARLVSQVNKRLLRVSRLLVGEAAPERSDQDQHDDMISLDALLKEYERVVPAHIIQAKGSVNGSFEDTQSIVEALAKGGTAQIRLSRP